MSTVSVSKVVTELAAYIPTDEEEIVAKDRGEIAGSVTMSRALAESAHGLGINEARIVMLALRCVDSRKSAYKQFKDGIIRVRITAAEFAQLANFGPNNEGYTPRAAYSGLRDACKRLYDRSTTWTDGKKTTSTRWTFKTVYHDGEAYAEIFFTPDITKHLTMLGEKFVRYRLEYARGLRSVYSTSLLRLLMTQKDTGFKTMLIADFAHAMDVPKTYKYGDIKRYAIIPAVQELNDKADLSITWKETKKGRTVSSVQFYFTFVDKKAQPDLFAEIEEAPIIDLTKKATEWVDE
jgi:plasmid replication initiation protein